MRKIVPLVLLVVLAGAACSSGDPEIVGIRASLDPAVGDHRYLFGISEIDGTRRGSPDEVVTLTATSLEDPDTSFDVEADFVWIVTDSIGLYRADIPFDRAGTWEIDFAISTGEATEPFLVLVGDEPTTVAVGDVAPRVDTPTLADRPIEDLTTDVPPDEAFYQVSLDEALENGKKTVAIFATPAYCTSATCGPMMRETKELAQRYPDVNWVHIEVYEGFNESGFAPDFDHLAPAVVAFGLPTEPWIFVMDEDGIVSARIEGVLAPGEIEQHLD